MIDNIQELFEKFSDEDENLKFDRVLAKLSLRPDMHAFLLLDSLVPPVIHPYHKVYGSDMICAAEDDEIFLATDVEELAKAASESDIRDLVRCGVRFDRDAECLAMFA